MSTTSNTTKQAGKQASKPKNNTTQKSVEFRSVHT